jgi:hypothetical protein
MSVNNWEHFFKSEVRASGRAFVTKGKVSLSQPSDTEIQSYVRASTSLKVSFKSDSVDSNTVKVDCTCSQSKKGQFCKHIWAALLLIEEKRPDFLESKTELQKSFELTHETLAHAESKTAYKLKQADYQKQQYQKQKQRLKNQKQLKKKAPATPEFPPTVELALKFFLDNGFPLRESLTKESVGIATRKLARVFHPDIGGSHSEILELNNFADILTKFLKS